MADNNNGRATKTRQTADNCRIITKDSVAVQLYEFGAEGLNIIKRVGPVRVSRELHLLPRREYGKHLCLALPELFFQCGQFSLLRCGPDFQLGEILNLLVQFLQRLLKIEIGCLHNCSFIKRA